MRSEDENRSETTAMRMMCGKTLKDNARNEGILLYFPLELRSQRLRWYDHVERMSQGKSGSRQEDRKTKKEIAGNH